MSLQSGLGNGVSNSEVAQERSRQQFVMETLCFCWYLNYPFPVDAFDSVVSAMGKIFFPPGGGRIKSGKFFFLASVAVCITFSLITLFALTEGEWYSRNHHLVADNKSAC